MVRGNYPVQDVEGSKPPQKDTSFKTCVVSMFIVFLLCIIIILILWRTKSDSGDRYTPAQNTSGTKLDQYIDAPPTFSSKPTTESPTSASTTERQDIKTDTSTTTVKDDATSMPTTVSTVKFGQIKQGVQEYENITTDTTEIASQTTAPDATTDMTVSRITSGTTEIASQTTAPDATTDMTVSRITSGTTEIASQTTAPDVTTDITVSRSKPLIQTSGTFTTEEWNNTQTTVLHNITTDLSSTKPDVTTPITTEETDVQTSHMVTQPSITESSISVFNSTATTLITTGATSEEMSTVVSVTQTSQLAVIVPTITPATHKDNETCETSECKVVASRMLSLMNHSVNPCNNFYEFACGGLRDNHGLLQDDPSKDVWNRIANAAEKVDDSSELVHQKFRHFYDQCVDYDHNVGRSDRLKLAQKVVGEVDNMYNNSQWVKEDKMFDFTNLLVKLFILDSAPLFDVSIDVNTQNTTEFQLKLTVPRSKSKLQLESLSEIRCKPHIKSDNLSNVDMKLVYEKKYLTCIRNFTEYFVTLKTAVMDLELYVNTDAAEVTEHVENITSFIKSDIFSTLQVIDPWRRRVNTLEKIFNVKTVKDLQSKYPEVKWKHLFDALFNTTVDDDTKVQVYFENYFDKLFSDLKVRLSDPNGRAVVHNGLLAMLAHDIYVDLVKPRPCDREDYCLKIASILMKYASSSLYLSTFTSKELSDKRYEMDTLFEQLKNVLKEEINKTNWLDQEARDNLLDKLSNMTGISHGSITNNSFLNNINFTDNHFENAIELLRQYRNTLVQHIGFSSSSPEAILFFSLPSDTHPMSVYALNTVFLPIGMIGSWKHTNSLPNYVLMARIGNEIARQIVHHFDTTGIRYSATGSDIDFLRGYSNNSYVYNYVMCEEGSHDKYLNWVNQRNQHYIYQVNAARTMNEHFTDNSALWLTHKLYNKTAGSEPVLPWLDMNHDKLYLLLTAQEFCAKDDLLDYTVTMFETEHFAPHLRVKNMIDNFEEFDDVYNCTTTNSGGKCAPFPKEDVNPI